MMKLIGVRRAFILACLLAVNVMIVSVYLFAVYPLRDEAENNLNTTVGEIGALRDKIQNIRQDMQVFKDTLPQYEALKAKGFFMAQDRFQMDRDLKRVQDEAELKGFSYTINDIQNMDSAAAAAASLRLISSRIMVTNVTSLLDVELYRFIEMMQRNFPSHVRLQSFTVRRVISLNEPTLKAIATGSIPSLINAEANFDWMTLVPVPPDTPGGKI